MAGPAEQLQEHAPAVKDNTALDPKYAVHWERPLPHMDSAFAKAYHAADKVTGAALCAVVLDPRFPLPLSDIAARKEKEYPGLQAVIASGKATLSTARAERFAIICEPLDGEPLSAFVQRNGALEERIALDHILRQIADALQALNDDGIVHGCINPDTVYYQSKTGRVMIRENLSDFCGHAQDPAYETLDRLCCHPAGKGYGDFSADYFALGVLALFLLTGRRPFAKMDAEKMLDLRMQNGSYEAALSSAGASDVSFSRRAHSLLRGLLSDSVRERWQGERMSEWLSKKDVVAPVSKMHKQASLSFMFDEKEYVSPKYLAHAIFRKWDLAKKGLKIQDLSRWAGLGLKNPAMGAALDGMVTFSAQEGLALPDERIARIIITLDPEGPVRLPEFSCHVFGMGGLLAYGYVKGERQTMQRMGEALYEGLVDFWTKQQPDPHYYTSGTLGWSPSKVRNYVRKSAFGFGMERCLYELNRDMPCQSPLVEGSLVTGMADLILALDKYAGEKENNDPVDRHVAAYIGSHLDLIDEVRIKSLQGFPHISRNPQLIMAALLTLAQSRTTVKSVKQLAGWMAGRLSILANLFNSQGIRKDLKRRLQQAAGEGKIQALVKVISDPAFASRDVQGFREARRQYRMLSAEIVKQKKRSNIEYTAYQAGLRFAVSVAYMVCIATMFYVMFRAI